MIPSHVLVPLDGSPLADEALAHALAVFDCRLTVLNVVTPLDTGMSEGGILELDEQRQAAARERANQLIDRAESQAAATGRPIETAVMAGDPAETILSFVEERDVDHIVMGGHGGQRRPITRRLLGTVATAVVGRSSVTVTVVR